MPLLRWLGHAATEININGKKIVIDPFIKNNPSAAVKIDYIYDTDIIIVTHDHYDHLGDTVEIMKNSNKPSLLATYDLEKYLNESYSIPWNRMIQANVGGYIDVDGIKIALTQAIHSSEHSDPTGVVISSEGITIYHAGDTGLFEGMKLIGDIFSPDYVLLPIGGRFTMDPYQASIAVEMLRPKKAAIPIHYNTWDLIKVNAEEFSKRAKERGFRAIILQPGQSIEL
jgi:L-ascorbate metabolism protein UlaG (beta-lactamase superfamily)